MKERRANIIIITLLISETLFLAPLLLNSVYGAPGSLWVSCGQSGVSVYLDSVYAGDTGSGGTIRVDGLDPGIVSVRGSRRKGDPVLVLNDFGECLGFGRIVGSLAGAARKGEIAVKNVSDVGDFLRREI